MSDFSDQPVYDVVDPEPDISDFVQDSPEQPVEMPSLSPTPEPVEDNTEIVGQPAEEAPVEDSSSECSIDDLYQLLQEIKDSDEEFQAAVLENQVYLAEQSKNLLSATILLLFIVSVLTGVLFARVLWRKI